jgi:tetratricopeptide (TPR) repeat protein
VTELRQAVVDHPEDLERRFALAKALEALGRTDEAEATLVDAKVMKPGEATYTELAGLYNRLGKFEKTMSVFQEWAAVDPTNKRIHYTIAASDWDRAYRTHTLTSEQKLALIAHGRKALDRALAIDPDYLDAVVYTGLLIRMEATLDTNPERQRALLFEAEQLQGAPKLNGNAPPPRVRLALKHRRRCHPPTGRWRAVPSVSAGMCARL